MGNPKVKWTSDEEDALKAGVAKHGTGRWKNILRDPEFAPVLINRSNIDLKETTSLPLSDRAEDLSEIASLPPQGSDKDKWRNMCIYTAAQGSRDKSRVARARPVAINALMPSTAQSLPAITSGFENEVIDDSPKSPQEGSNAPNYNDMIFEAISSMKGSNGSDLGAIVGFIEQRHEVPPNFRRFLSSKLRRLVLQGKLEKVQNCYKMKDAPLETRIPTPKQNDETRILAPKQNDETKIPTPKQNDVRSWPVPNSVVKVSCGTAEEAARIAADKIADAENKRCLEVDAIKDAEMKSKMAEEAESMLQLVKEIYEQCSRGEIVLLA